MPSERSWGKASKPKTGRVAKAACRLLPPAMLQPLTRLSRAHVLTLNPSSRSRGTGPRIIGSPRSGHLGPNSSNFRFLLDDRLTALSSENLIRPPDYSPIDGTLSGGRIFHDQVDVTWHDALQLGCRF